MNKFIIIKTLYPEVNRMIDAVAYDVNDNVVEYDLAAVALEVSIMDVREQRDSLIAATDWWALPDRTMSAEQKAYRQALRDITAQSGFPTDITWPTKPE
tara:strand:+ start:218 stop:514 length:297 start_codon:yes stop_codon:yes gene_type:complete